jgi:hypothetical protein
MGILSHLSIKDILNQVLGECGFVTQSAFFASTDPAVLQLAYIANASVRTLRKYQWKWLLRSSTLALTTGTELYEVTGEDRDVIAVVPDTTYKVGNYYPVDLPATTEYWAQLKSAGAIGFQYECRLMGPAALTTSGASSVPMMRVLNAVTGDSLRYEYISAYMVRAASVPSVEKEAFTADTDCCGYDDELITRDIKWRFKKEKGFDDWQVDLEDFKSYAAWLRGVDSGAQTIRFGRPAHSPHAPQSATMLSDF